MPELEKKIEDIKKDITKTIGILINGYKIACNEKFDNAALKKNISIVQKRIKELEEGIRNNHKFSFGTFALETALSFVMGIGTNLALKKAYGSLRNPPLKEFEPNKLRIQEKSILLALGREVKTLNKESLEKNWDLTVKHINHLIDVLNEESSIDQVISNAAYDSFMSVTFLVTHAFVENTSKTHLSNNDVSNWFLDLSELQTFVNAQIVGYWTAYEDFLDNINKYAAFYVAEKGLTLYLKYWNRGGSKKFEKSIEELIANFYEYAMYIGLSGEISGYFMLRKRYIRFKRPVAYANADNSLLTDMWSSKYIKTGFERHISWIAVNSISEKLFPLFKHSSRVDLRIKYNCLLCYVSDVKRYVVALNLTEYKYEINRKWTKWIPIQVSKSKLIKYIILKEYIHSNIVINSNKYIDGAYKGYNGDLLLPYMENLTKKTHENKILPVFKSKDSFVSSMVGPNIKLINPVHRVN